MKVSANAIDAIEIMDEMFLSGYKLVSGCHTDNLRGYFAKFYLRTDSRQGPPFLWEECGHGETLLQALEQARSIALGYTIMYRRPEYFLR